MTTTDYDALALRDLIDEVFIRCADVSPNLAEHVRGSGWEDLSDDEARRLFTRILSIVRSVDETSGPDRSEAEADIQATVAEIMEQRTTSPGESNEAVAADAGNLLYAAHGVSLGEVRPTPVFNGEPIPMTEGYVKITDLKPWMGNPRLELHVEAFRREFDREPSSDDIVRILSGAQSLKGMSLSKRDPFELEDLARSIAAKGVLHPPVIDRDGVPRDGNRRVAACYYIQGSGMFDADEKRRASEVRVWLAPNNTTPDQFDAIVAALNFEPDYKLKWPTYLKARQVVKLYNSLVDNEPSDPSARRNMQIKQEVARKFGIRTQEVTRYIKMVTWAEDFAAYHVEVKNEAESAVEFRTVDIFEWFYELDAGKGDDKLTEKLDEDPVLKDLVYDLMYRDKVLNTGVQVRGLHKAIKHGRALELLFEAQDESNPVRSNELVREAFEEARRDRVSRSTVTFADFVENMIKKLDDTPPAAYGELSLDLLAKFKHALDDARALVGNELDSRSASQDASGL